MDSFAGPALHKKVRNPTISRKVPDLSFLVADTGFEPVKALPADLQSAPFGHSGNLPWPAKPKTSSSAFAPNKWKQ